MLGTKERIIAERSIATERYVLSTMPRLYIPFWKKDWGGSDQFLSSDGTGHVCTRVGAIWTPQGAYLDGTDDYINIPDAFNSLSVGTLIAWIKLDALGINHDLFSCSTLADNNDFFNFDMTSADKLRIIAGNGTAFTVTGTTDNLLVASQWLHVALVVSTTGNIIYKNVIQQAVTYTVGNATTQAFFNTPTGAKETYLCRFPFSSVYYARLKGILGEAYIYDYPFTPPKVLEHRQQTEWRFR